MGAWRHGMAVCHTKRALRNVDGTALRAPRHPGSFAFEESEWQVSYQLLAALQSRGCVLDQGTVRVVCALVAAWPNPSDRK